MDKKLNMQSLEFSENLERFIKDFKEDSRMYKKNISDQLNDFYKEITSKLSYYRS